MKIGVLTFWNSDANYGMMLQCWALQQVLKSIGHQPYLIRFARSPIKSSTRKILEAIGLYKLFLRLIYPEKFLLLRKKLKHDKQRQFKQFLKRNITLSSKKYSTLKQIQRDSPAADCYIVGSDQVWSQTLDNQDNQAYFLKFGGNSTKRVSYAPSFGFPNYPDNLLKVLKDALSRFDFISCREQSGVEICKGIGFEATKVLDPTMLLDRKYYDDLAASYSAIADRPYVFIYSLNIKSSDEIRFQELELYMNNESLDLVVTPSDGYCQGLELFGTKAIYSYATIGQWLSNIIHSELVITPSFHGVVLSIVLNKDFIYTPLAGFHSPSNERILGLLKDLNLESRILDDKKSIQDIIKKPINWANVNHKLTKLKNDSTSFLSRALS